MQNDDQAGGKRVLIVEDEYLTALELAAAVERLGNAVVAMCADLRSARDLLATSEVDFVLLDVNLSGVFSFALADELISWGTPLAFISGYPRAHIPDRYAHVPHCPKPFNTDLLREVLARS